MSKGLIHADVLEVRSLAAEWLRGRGLRICEGPLSPSQVSAGGESLVTGVGWLYLVTIRCRSENQGSHAQASVRLRGCWNGLLHGILALLLGVSVALIHQLLGEWTIDGVAWLVVCVLLLIAVFHWQGNGLAGRLARTELSFWDSARKRYDVESYTRVEGQLYRRRSRLLIELMFAGYVVVVLGVFLQMRGVVLALALCLPILVMIVADVSRGDDPAWHWRLWIVGNMSRWTCLMLFVIGMGVVLIALEGFMGLEMYKDPDAFTVRRAIAEGRLREIRPATADRLEADINGRLWDMSAPESTDGDPGRQKVRFIGNSIMCFLVIVVSVVCFVLVPFSGLLRSQGRWAPEIGERDARNGPYVPYLPEAWKRRVPRLLRGVIVFHAVFGSLVHVAATAFCIEGISYAFLGRTILWDQAANLWSWVFALSKILFGNSFGWRAGLFLVAAVSSPVLMMLGAFARRMLLSVLLTMRFRLIRRTNSKDHPQCFERIECFMENVCSREHISRPALWLTSCDDVVIRLRGVLLSRTAVLEISRGTVNLLDEDELNSVIAHELGHLSQGIRKVGLLKSLSSLALFPNHYLTLCLNWPASEIEADRFALSMTGNPEALRRAVLKISTAQMNCLRLTFGRRSADMVKRSGIKGGVLRRIRGALRIEYGSIRFFFGDRLLGYTHPYVSERLEAIGPPHGKTANESEG